MAKVSSGAEEGRLERIPIRCEGPRIQLWLNGVQTVDYTEPDEKIARDGKIAVQIHGGAEIRGVVQGYHDRGTAGEVAREFPRTSRA